VAEQAQRDVDAARNWAAIVLEKVAYVDVGQRSPVVVMTGGKTVDRRVMLHGTYARRVLRSMDADLARLQAAARAAAVGSTSG